VVAITKNGTSDQALQEREAIAQMAWTTGIIAFFGLQAILWSVAIFLTSNDPSHAIVENYDKKAMNWDAQREAEEASRKLGWTCEISPSAPLKNERQRTVEICLRDRKLEPISGATVSVRTFHKARAAHPVEQQLAESGAGVYSCVLEMPKQGQWQFEVTADLGDDHFRSLQVLQVGDPRLRSSKK
jgi:nitrogen fixation protein FixH